MGRGSGQFSEAGEFNEEFPKWGRQIAASWRQVRTARGRNFTMLPRSRRLVWSDNVVMRRWMFIAALGVGLLATPLWGQRGGHGGMGMGGVHGGYVTHSGGGFAGTPHGGAYWGGGFHGGFGHGPYPSHFPHYPGRYPYYPGRYPWWGYRGAYGYGWWGYPSAWGWYGGVGWSGAYDSYPAQSYPVYAYSNPDNANANVTYDQQQEINRLNDEVARLRAEQHSGAAGSYAPRPLPKA